MGSEMCIRDREYSLIKAASEKGWINEQDIFFETLVIKDKPVERKG